MSLDCVIRVKVRNRSRGSMSELEGPVSRFIRDSEDYYKAVEAHLRKCRRCDPAEALSGFMKNRRARFDGKVSGLLYNMAMRYGRKFGDRIPEGLIREFRIGYLMNWVVSPMEEILEGLRTEDVRKAYDGYILAYRKAAARALTDGRTERVEPYPMYGAQSVIGWKNEESPRSSLEIVPLDVQFYSSLSEADAEEMGSRALAVWLITRHSWEAALADPDDGVSGLARSRLASDVMGS